VKIRKETVAVDEAEPGFVHVSHQQIIQDSGRDMGGELWFERDHVRWVIDKLRGQLTTYAFPEAELQHGRDRLRVWESGPEQQPFINVFNTRPEDAPRGGMFALSISRPVAEQLLAQLDALG
jgi:hypothetical protein